MDNADFIESCELQLWGIVYKMHKAGVRYSIIHEILKDMISVLEIQDYCEKWFILE